MVDQFLAVDLGGTKIAVGVVSASGEVRARNEQHWDQSRGPVGLIEQMTTMMQPLLAQHNVGEVAGIASAGPVDQIKGQLLNPSNMVTGGKHWGVVDLVSPLNAKLGLSFKMENDAACAVLAERWVGGAQGINNCMALTLGTGVGTGVICNGKLLRSGRHLHPEAGQIYLNADDRSSTSGSGDQGTIEAFLSGKNFARRVGQKMNRPLLTGVEIVELAQQGHEQILNEFSGYALNLARAIRNFVYLFAPEVIVLSGGFSVASPFFLEQTTHHLEELLAPVRFGIDLLPELKVSSFQKDMGLIGAAFVARQQSLGNADY